MLPYMRSLHNSREKQGIWNLCKVALRAALLIACISGKVAMAQESHETSRPSVAAVDQLRSDEIWKIPALQSFDLWFRQEGSKVICTVPVRSWITDAQYDLLMDILQEGFFNNFPSTEATLRVAWNSWSQKYIFFPAKSGITISSEDQERVEWVLRMLRDYTHLQPQPVEQEPVDDEPGVQPKESPAPNKKSENPQPKQENIKKKKNPKKKKPARRSSWSGCPDDIA